MHPTAPAVIDSQLRWQTLRIDAWLGGLALATVLVAGCQPPAVTEAPATPPVEGTKAQPPEASTPADEDDDDNEQQRANETPNSFTPDAIAPPHQLTSTTNDVIGETVAAGASFAGMDPRLEAVGDSPLFREREMLDKTLWADEIEAQKHEQTFVKLWDDIRAAGDKFTVLATFPFAKITLAAPGEAEDLRYGITYQELTGDERTLTAAEFAEQVQSQIVAAGYRLVEVEFHHSKFNKADGDRPADSEVSTLLHIVNEQTQERVLVKGNLQLTWTGADDEAGRPIIADVTATDFFILRRTGAPVFEEIGKYEYVVDSSGKTAPTTTHPLILHDLNRDGLSEFIVGAYNEVHWNRGDGEFEQGVLCADPAKLVNSGVLGDFDGDGRTDLFLGTKNANPLLYFGDDEGRFEAPPREILACGERLRSPTTITAGDVDADGDLDVWIGQYKPPYLEGNMPTPFYDANDGFPAFLLLNEGDGQFIDATESAGLAPKRFRRMYSSSFVDLNGDDALDLIVASDFAGIDVYYNDGAGKFSDVTAEVVPENDAFGMSHTFGDYNADGRLDFFVIGMSSTTARRLDHLGLGRQDFADRTAARGRMGYGNRMFLATANGGFEQAPFNNQVNRSGWSWGSTTLDADNDGRHDLYVCNGFMSGESCKDYCTRYWTHDVYTGASEEDEELKIPLRAFLARSQ